MLQDWQPTPELVERLNLYADRQRKHAVSAGVYVKALLRDGASLDAIYREARAAARRAQTATDLVAAVRVLREMASPITGRR